MPKTLKTNTSVWTRVFRRIVLALEADPDVRRVVGDQLRSWKGIPGDKNPMTPFYGQPVVRLTPQPAGVEWYDPATQAGTLHVLVELAIQSLCIDDVADLWDTIVQALGPGSGTLGTDLVALGAETGEILFGEPAYDPRPEAEPEGYFLGTGRFSLKLVRYVDP